MEKLISVIIIAYNMEKYVERAIESVEKQSYKNIEIIVVNDGSTDSTVSVCKKHSINNKRLKIISQKNKGQFVARMTGVLNSRGEYIGFMDADDILASDMYELLLSNLLDYDADISHCGYTMIRPNGEEKDYYGTEKLLIQDHDKGLIDLLEGKFIEPTACTKLYKRSLFDNINILSDVRILEDLMLNYFLFKNAKRAVYKDVCKYFYYKRDDSVSRSTSIRQFYDPLTVKEMIYLSCDDECIRVKEVAKHNLATQYLMNCFSIKVNSLNEYTTVYIKNRSQLRRVYKNSFFTKNEKIKALIILYAPCLCKVVDKLYRFLNK